MPALLSHELPFRLVAVELAIVDVRALLKADHPSTCFGKMTRSNRPRCAGANDQNFRRVAVAAGTSHASSPLAFSCAGGCRQVFSLPRDSAGGKIVDISVDTFKDMRWH